MARGQLDPLSSGAAAEGFFQTLPRDDPIASQRMVCAALAQVDARRDSGPKLLEALLALDRMVRPLYERLQTERSPRGAGGSDREAQLRKALMELSRSLAQGYEAVIRRLSERRLLAAPAVASSNLPLIVVQLLRYRE